MDSYAQIDSEWVCKNAPFNYNNLFQCYLFS